VKVNRRFGGTHLLHIHGRKKAKKETSMKMVAACLMLGLLLAYFSTLKI
jgi:hypothetical protein